MAFRTKAWATVWEVIPSANGKSTKVRLSTSRKKQDGSYEQDFSGFCLLIGQANTDAAHLRAKDRIQIGDCEVTNNYDKASGREFVNYKIFNFTLSEAAPQSNTSQSSSQGSRVPDFGFNAEEGDTSEDNLPF